MEYNETNSQNATKGKHTLDASPEGDKLQQPQDNQHVPPNLTGAPPSTSPHDEAEDSDPVTLSDIKQTIFRELVAATSLERLLERIGEIHSTTGNDAYRAVLQNALNNVPKSTEAHRRATNARRKPKVGLVQCILCSATMTTKSNLESEWKSLILERFSHFLPIDHFRSHLELKAFGCSRCGKTFTTANTLKRHVRINCKAGTLSQQHPDTSLSETLDTNYGSVPDVSDGVGGMPMDTRTEETSDPRRLGFCVKIDGSDYQSHW